MTEAANRLVALLRMSRCEIEVERGEHDLFVIESFSPTGVKRTIGIIHQPEVFESTRATGQYLRQEVRRKELLHDALVVYVHDTEPRPALSETGPDSAAEPGVPVASMTELAHSIVSATHFKTHYRKAVSELVDTDSVLKVPCRVRRAGQSAGSKFPDALGALVEFVRVTSSGLCLLSGGFGTGKTVLMHQLAYRLAKKPEYFPILIDLSGVGSRGIGTAAQSAVAGLFRSLTQDELGNLRQLLEMLGSDVRIVLLFDSLDEQIELNSNEVGKIIDQLLGFVTRQFVCITAFRPEMFENSLEAAALFEDRLLPEGVNCTEITLFQFNGEDYERSVAGLLEKITNPSARAIAEQLAKRPIWYGIVRRMAEFRRGNPVELSLLQFVEYLIGLWSEREAQTNRPILVKAERDMLTMVLAFCVHSGQAIRMDRPGSIARAQLVELVRRILPAMQVQESDLADFMRWRRLPPDLTAESLAVSNLLELGHDGQLKFSDSIFLKYYLALGVVAALLDEKLSALNERPFLELLGVPSRRELVGLLQFPGGEFPVLLRELAERQAAGDRNTFTTGCIRHLGSLRSPAEAVTPPPVDELTDCYVRGLSEEGRTYQIVPRPHWPQAGQTFAAGNCIEWLMDSARQVCDIDLSFLDLSGYDFRHISFLRCDFQGTNLSDTKLHGTRFADCNLRLALFEGCEGLTSSSFQFCDLAQTVFLESPPFDDETRRNRSKQILVSLQRDDEVWVEPDIIQCLENCGVPVRLSRFLADSGPVTNGQFREFIKAAPEYAGIKHAADIENPYYLTLLDNHDEALPVVYVSLVASVAYAVWQGKRLPSVAEFKAYDRLVRSRVALPEELSAAVPGSYDSLPRRVIGPGVVYPMDLVTEWSFQIDDLDYWDGIRLRSGRDVGTRMNQFPPYRQRSVRRCEYFILGQSTQPKMNSYKNSKLATWFNPDQSFRCVTDYHVAARRLCHPRLPTV